MRLKTLIALRWFAVIGQAITVLVVHYWLEFELPLAACLSVIALSAWLNVAMSMHYRNVQRLAPGRSRWLLAYDIAQLTVLMVLTGGLENPFAFLILAPVLIAAISLPLRYTLPLGAVRGRLLDVIAFVYWPLPWTSGQALMLPPLYILAIWLSNLVAIVFIGAYAWQVAEEGRLMADALTATELVLAREQHLSQLDGLAAAAAHELGTPLSTIAVVAKELQHALGPDSPHAEDVKLLREQAQRCRDILGKLSALPSELGAVRAREALRADRGGGGAAPQFRHRDRCGAAAGSQRRAGGRALAGGALRARQSGRERGRLRQGAGGDRGALERAGCRGDDLRRRAGLSAGNHAPHRRALCDQPPQAGAARARRAGSASASSSPRRCWSAPARRSPSSTGQPPEQGAVVRVRWARGDFEVAAEAAGT